MSTAGPAGWKPTPGAVGLPKGPPIRFPVWSNTRMSGVNGFFGSKAPVPKLPCSLHTLGRPWPDSRTYTWNFCELPRNAIPVGEFRSLAKTDTLNVPCGASMTMSEPPSGLNNANSVGQIGFVTVAACPTTGKAAKGTAARAAVALLRKLTRMAFSPPPYHWWLFLRHARPDESVPNQSTLAV